MTETSSDVLARDDSGWRLKLVVVVSGAVLMGLELTGSRIIAAHFGSSIYVWGAIIGVFLTSLAAGYYLGGNLADRRPDFFLLNLLLLIAGAWLLTIPIYADWLCRGVRHLNPGVRTGPLLATLLMFGGPSVLMGMVSPFAVRLAACTVERMGNLSGRLYALSTFGSIVGTMVTAYWLIPSMGVRRLMQLLGLCLLVLPFLVLPKSRRLLVLALPLLIVIASLFLVEMRESAPSGKRRIVYEADSAYHHILVIDDLQLNARYLQFNSNLESGIDLNPPHETRFAYTDSLHLARIFQPNLKRVLIIGGGGGVSARKFVMEDREVVVDLVEIDPMVVELSYRYFYVQPDDRLRVHTEDGRAFVRRAIEKGEKYDLVVLDAYTVGAQIPFHLTTREFMEEVRGVLTPGGVLLANIANALEGTGSRVMRSEYKTLAAVFPHLFTFPLRRNDERDQNKALDPMKKRNIILIATNGPGEWTRDSIVIAAGSVSQAGPELKKSLVVFARQLMHEAPRTDDVPLLTDDYAPVDTMVF